MSLTEDFLSPAPQTDWGTIKRAGFGTVNYGQQQVVHFYWRSLQNMAKSRQAGAPIFEKKIFVEIAEPGDHLTRIDREATEADRANYPTQWNQFRENKAQVPEGTPIEQLFPADPNIADQLRGWGVHTIQQLSKLSGHAIGSIGMGAQSWVNLANDYLSRAKEGVDFHKIEEMRIQFDRDLNVERRNNAVLLDRVAKLESYINTIQGHAIAAMPQMQSVVAPPPRALDAVHAPVPQVEPWKEAPANFFVEETPPEEPEATKPKGRK